MSMRTEITSHLWFLNYMEQCYKNKFLTSADYIAFIHYSILIKIDKMMEYT